MLCAVRRGRNLCGLLLFGAVFLLLTHRAICVEDISREEQSILEQHAGLGRGVLPMATQQATFAAGCFWSVELDFQRVPGVTKVGCVSDSPTSV
jgi:hypothetical protein